MAGLLGGLNDFLGTSDPYKATPYQPNPGAASWQGPQQGQLSSYLTGSQGQAANDYGQQQQANNAQSDYIGQLKQAAAGNGPSQAQGILQQGSDRAAAQSISLARSGGGNPAQQAAAMRAGMQQGAAGMTSAGAQAAQIKAQEQQAAMGQLGGAINQQRAQDLQSMGMGNEMSGQYLGAQMQQGQAQLGANMQMAGLNSQNYNAAQDINAGVSKENTAANGQMLGAVTGAAGSLAMFSDIRAKSDVVDANGNYGRNLGGPGHEVYDLPEMSGDSQAYKDGRGGDIRYVDPTMGGPLGAPGAVDVKDDPLRASAQADGPNPVSGGLGSALLGFSAGLNGKTYKPPPKDKSQMVPPGQRAKLGEMLDARAAQPGPTAGPVPTDAQMTGADRPALGQVMAPGAPGAPPALPDNWQNFTGAPPPQTFARPPMNPNIAVTVPDLTMPGAPAPYVASDARIKAAIAPASASSMLMDGRFPYSPPGNNDYPRTGGIPNYIVSDERTKVAQQSEGTKGRYTEPREYPQQKHHNEASLLNRREDPGSGYQVVARSGGRELQRLTRESDDELPPAPPVMRESMLGSDAPTVYSDEKVKKGLSDADMKLLDTRVADSPERREQLKAIAHMEAEEPHYQARHKATADAEFNRNYPQFAYAKSPPPLAPEMGSEADHFLSHLHPYSYRYTDPSYEPTSQPNGGRYLGVMAQDVEKAPGVGSQIVKDTPRGKVLEGGALMSAMAAGLGRLHERVAGLEGKPR